MSQYIYRGVTYLKTSDHSTASRNSTFIYRGIGYVKKDPIPAKRNADKIIYRGFPLLANTVNHRGSFQNAVVAM